MPSSSSFHPLAPPDSPPRLTIVIVNYNGWDDVARLVAALASASEIRDGRADIVVVDNASDGPVPPELTPPPPGVRLILRPDNGGFAVGVNAGWRASRAPWLLLLNPDVEAGPDLIGRILDRIDHHGAQRDGPPGIVGFSLLNADGSKQPSVGVEPGLVRSVLGQFIPRSRRKYQAGWRTRPGPVAWVTGACLLVDASLMRALGGMDEDYFLYYEEVALCRSARDRGRRVEYDDAVSVVHLRPLQSRAVPPKLRVIVRHAKLLYFRNHLPAWQFRLLSRIIAAEAAIRAGLAWRRGDRPSLGAWRIIGKMAGGMRRGATIRGRDVRLLAESATDGHASRPIGLAPRNGAVHSGRRRGRLGTGPTGAPPAERAIRASGAPPAP